jgi:uncharacterized SAM-binding protein YcdF (DUF218 family)
MFYLFKVLTFFLNPFIWIIILLSFTLFSKKERKRKKLISIAFIMIVFFSNPWIIIQLLYPLHAPPMPMREKEHYEVGVVLGGITSYDKVNKAGHFNMSSDRFIQTALLYKTGHIKKIIASGGRNGMFLEDNFIEAAFIAKNLEDLGIPKQDIIIEGNSKNTQENAENTKKILDSLGANKTKTVLITSAFHIPRAEATFKSAGVNVRPYPCAFSILPSSVKFSAESLLPSTSAMDAWAGLFKELIGIAYIKMKN